MQQERFRIVVVDRVPDDGAAIRALLGAGHEVEAVDPTRAEAIAGLAARRPDLVLLDQRDLGLCPAVVAACDGVPVLALLAEDASGDAEPTALRAGAVDVLRRPLQADLVQLRLGERLRARRRLVAAETAMGQMAGVKAVILALLQTALRPMPLQTQLEAILDAIAVLPWLESEGRGGIFLTDDSKELVLSAARGVGLRVETQCADPRRPHCACVAAARGGTPVFVSRVPPACSIAGLGPDDPGLYCLPLRAGERTLGVLAVLVHPGHHPAPEEAAFMDELATTVATLISRRLMQSVLEIHRYEVQAAQSDVIRLLGRAAEYRDTDTGLHTIRVAYFCRCIADHLGLSPDACELLFQAAPMHDIGKIGIPDAILKSPRRLEEPEFAVMKTHTLIGEEVLRGETPLIVAARAVAGGHHEKWDGSGYPRGLAGEAIPLFARICAVADVFDALGQARPYKPEWDMKDVLAYLRQQAGLQFDPAVLAAFFDALPEILRFRTLYSDEALRQHAPLHLPPLAAPAETVFPWLDQYTLGIPIIDEHHRYLLDLMNMLHEAVTRSGQIFDIAQALKALESYSAVHFREEERLMVQAGYPGLSEHVAEHRGFVADIARTWQSLRDNPLFSGWHTLKFLSDWLINHIQESDARAAAAIRAANR